MEKKDYAFKRDVVKRGTESIIMSGLSSALDSLESQLGKLSIVERDLKTTRRFIKNLLAESGHDSSISELDAEPAPAPLITEELETVPVS